MTREVLQFVAGIFCLVLGLSSMAQVPIPPWSTHDWKSTVWSFRPYTYCERVSYDAYMCALGGLFDENVGDLPGVDGQDAYIGDTGPGAFNVGTVSGLVPGSIGATKIERDLSGYCVSDGLTDQQWECIPPSDRLPATTRH